MAKDEQSRVPAATLTGRARYGLFVLWCLFFCACYNTYRIGIGPTIDTQGSLGVSATLSVGFETDSSSSLTKGVLGTAGAGVYGPSQDPYAVGYGELTFSKSLTKSGDHLARFGFLIGGGSLFTPAQKVSFFGLGLHFAPLFLIGSTNSSEIRLGPDVQADIFLNDLLPEYSTSVVRFGLPLTLEIRREIRLGPL